MIFILFTMLNHWSQSILRCYAPSVSGLMLLVILIILVIVMFTLILLLSPSGDLGIGLVWDNRTTPQPLFGQTVEILFKLN